MADINKLLNQLKYNIPYNVGNINDDVIECLEDLNNLKSSNIEDELNNTIVLDRLYKLLAKSITGKYDLVTVIGNIGEALSIIEDLKDFNNTEWYFSSE